MAAPATHRIQMLGRLSAEQTDDVSRLVLRATEADGVHPLSEHVSLHLRHGGDAPVRNFLLYLDDPAAPDTSGRPPLAGYAHLDVTDVVAGSSAEVVVDPERRGQGLGHALVSAVCDQTPDRRLRLWAHGEHPAAARLAAAMGLRRSRTLRQMRRSLRARLPHPELPDGVMVRTFRPGIDDAAWLRLNVRAFADHPEQARWTADDLRVRRREPWFDPAGFFLAVRHPGTERERLVGFHWTKVHGGLAEHEHEQIGEVYVVGVDPDEQGRGLGRALTLVGLHHLRGLGLQDAMLYVDADNVAAVAVYQRLGFTVWETDVMYSGLPD